MSALAAALLAELDEAALAELGRRLAPYLPSPEPPFPDGLLTTAEAARHASVHPETIRRAIRSGHLPIAGRVGRTPRLAIADLDAWLSADRTQAPKPHRAPRSRTTTIRRGRPLADALALQRGPGPRPSTTNGSHP